MTDTATQEPSIGISYQIELPGKRQIVLQSFVPRDGDTTQFNAILDKMRVGAERQFAFGMIDVLNLQLEQEMKLASDHAKRMAQVDQNIKSEWDRTGRRGEVMLSQKQRQEQQQAYAHAEESKLRIAKVKADLASYQAKINGNARTGA